MKNALPIAVLGILACAAAQAQAPAAAPATAPGVSFTVTGSVVSQYMFRGQRLNGAGFQPSVEMAAGNFTLGVWSNVVLDDKVADSSDPEIDAYGSYTMTINKDFALVPGFTFYTYPSAPTSAGFYRSTFEPNVAVNTSLAGIKLTPKFYYDTVYKGATYELTAAYAVPLAGIGSELGFTAVAGTSKLRDVVKDATPSVKAWGDYWLVGVAMPFQIDKESKLVLGYAYTKGRNAYTKQGSLARTPNPLAVGRGVATISYSVSF
ncbi:MAG: hypothetical protein FJ399_10090 [Verrucomicrobia bacterium]|nr:hypothetical protein [Verrucomicrobiota bacterium]